MVPVQSSGTPTASADERRALDAEEWSLADQTRQPAVAGLDEEELGVLIARLRDRRDRARDLADRQAREARSKASPTGARAATSDTGMRLKHEYLGEALERAIAERDRRGKGEGGLTQADLARKAQEMKETGATGPSAMAEDGGPLHPQDPDASAGKGALSETARRAAPSGALDHAGELPSRERSRTRY